LKSLLISLSFLVTIGFTGCGGMMPTASQVNSIGMTNEITDGANVARFESQTVKTLPKNNYTKVYLEVHDEPLIEYSEKIFTTLNRFLKALKFETVSDKSSKTRQTYKTATKELGVKFKLDTFPLKSEGFYGAYPNALKIYLNGYDDESYIQNNFYKIQENCFAKEDITKLLEDKYQLVSNKDDAELVIDAENIGCSYGERVYPRNIKDKAFEGTRDSSYDKFSTGVAAAGLVQSIGVGSGLGLSGGLIGGGLGLIFSGKSGDWINVYDINVKDNVTGKSYNTVLNSTMPGGAAYDTTAAIGRTLVMVLNTEK